MTRRSLLLLSAGLALAGGLAATSFSPVQASDPQRTRGTIESFQGDKLEITTRDGHKAAFTLTDKTGIAAVSEGDPEDIRPGSYVGTAAIPQADGSLRALELHVFAPSLAGTGEGHHSWDLAPDSTMTNGRVGNVVVSDGRTVTVQYGGDEKKIFVPTDVPVVSLAPGDRSLLKPGAQVLVFGEPEAPMTVARLSVGVDGIKPPM